MNQEIKESLHHTYKIYRFIIKPYKENRTNISEQTEEHENRARFANLT